MRPLRFIASGASALLVLLFVIAPANAQTVPRCRDISGGALDVGEIKNNSGGSDVLMSTSFVLPEFTPQELLGIGRSDSSTAFQTSVFTVGDSLGRVLGATDFAPPITLTVFTGKASLTWKKYVRGRKRRILRNLRVTYRLLNNGIPVTGLTHVTDAAQVLDLVLRPIEPRILCKVKSRRFIVEGGVEFELELRKLVRSGDHNVSVEVSVDAP